MEDSQIMELYWQRSADAIAQTAGKYGAYCLAIAEHNLRSAEDSEECVNDTWLRAWNAIPPQRPGSLRMFLAKITRNLAFDRLRAQSAEKRGGGEITLVLDNGDGTWAVVSRGDFEYLCLSQYDTDGNELFFHKTAVGNFGIWNVVRLGDGYLAQLGNTTDGETALLVKLDRNGSVRDTFTYEGEDCDYHITDMIEFGGRVYLSAYAVPKQTDAGGRYEIADILAYLFDNNVWEISSEELTPMVRDNYTAVLLLCDPEGGAPETFYSVKGSLGGKLAVNGAGELAWNVESVVDSFFSPATNSFTIGGTCQVFRYTFDNAGTLLRQEDTGETVPYCR